VKVISIPSAAAQYNDEMNAVDRGDQMRAYEGYDHAIRRGGWQAIAWTFLLDTVIINSYILQLHGEPAWAPCSPQVKWRERLVDGLIELYAMKADSRKRFRTGDEFTPISQHKHVNRKKNSRCVACRGRRLGESFSRSSQRGPLKPLNNNERPRQTRSGCDKCNIALCTKGNCWDFWHHIK
jgi:hypothetical protein